MVNVFVTGASGFIGSHLCDNLTLYDDKVVILCRDFLPAPWQNWLNEALDGCTLIRGDILDDKLIRRILTEYRIDHVYHLAAQAIVSTALKDPAGTIQNNIIGTLNILEACRQLEVPKVLVLSTDKVYGDVTNAAPFHDPVVAGGPYETSKSMQDLLSQCYMKTYDMNVIIARSCNCYGYDLSPRIIPNTIRSCLRGEPPIIYEGEETLRQYIYVVDLVSALTYLMDNIEQGIFNIATDDILDQAKVVYEICKYFPISPRMVQREKPMKEIKQQSLVCSKFGWSPQHNFNKAIQATIERFKKYGF